MSSSPPPPYSLRPPPYVRPRSVRKNSPPPLPKSPRPSSRELLTDALRRAQHAVTLDSKKNEFDDESDDVPAAIAAYDEAIGLLRRVVERRSQRPGNANEVERVRDIHDRYVRRVRELCLAHGLPIPVHADPTPPPTFASAEDPPSKMKKSKPTVPPLTRTAFVRRLRLKHQRSYTADHADDQEEDDRDDDDYEYGWEQGGGPPPSLSSPLSTSLTIETRSPVSPVVVDEDAVVHHHHDDLLPHDDRRWISSAACDEEVKEWGKYLDEGGENRRRPLSGATAASSSTGWSAIAVSCGDCVYF